MIKALSFDYDNNDNVDHEDSIQVFCLVKMHYFDDA